MKFSVALPTRNRLEYLPYVLESIRQQDWTEWEVVIYDNFSEQDVGAYIASLNEPRIRYYRTSSSVPVTENWNNAINCCTGDYVVMVGDDDILMKGYFSAMNALLRAFPDPDLIYNSAYLYAYPGVMPGESEGYLVPHGYAFFLRDAHRPYWLDRELAWWYVNQPCDSRFAQITTCNSC